LIDLLPDDTKQAANAIRLRYRLNLIASDSPYLPAIQARLLNKPPHILELQSQIERDFPVAIHPAASPHPSTQQMTLNVTAMHLCVPENEECDTDRHLMNELVQHSWNAGTRYYRAWQTEDVILWDNQRLIHLATGTPINATRLLHRCGLADI
jgi:alpha-ketoglutarate-dependent taurine dioxygenase